MLKLKNENGLQDNLEMQTSWRKKKEKSRTRTANPQRIEAPLYSWL